MRMDISNPTKYLIYSVFFFLGILGLFQPMFYVGIIFLSFLLFLWRFDLVQLNQILCYGIVLSMFFGAYLSVPGYESLYLFRFLLPAYLVLFLMIGEFNFSGMKQYKLPILCLIIFLVLSLTSYFYADYPSVVFRATYFAFEILFIFLVTFKTLNQESLKWVLRIIVIAFVSNLLVGMVEVLFGIHLYLSSANTYVSTTIKYQPTGFYFNTNDYALYISLYYPIVILTIQRIKQVWLKSIVYVLITSMSLFVVISSYSRIGMLCIGISSVTLFFTLYRKKAALISLIFGPPSVLFFSMTSFGSNLFEIISNSFENKTTSTSVRRELYEHLWEISRDSHFLGIGAGGAPKKLGSLFLGFENTDTSATVTGHNLFLEILANLGALGFLCMVVLLLYLFILQVKMYWYNYMLKNNYLILSTIVSFLILMTFSGSTIALSTTLEKRFLWFGLALAYSLVNMNFADKDITYQN